MLGAMLEVKQGKLVNLVLRSPRISGDEGGSFRSMCILGYFLKQLVLTQNRLNVLNKVQTILSVQIGKFTQNAAPPTFVLAHP